MEQVAHRPALVVLDPEGPNGPRRIALPDVDQVIVGRSLAADVSLEGVTTLSRCHVRLERGATGWTMLDLGSANGTRLNQVLAAGVVPLMHGDEVECGTLRFRFEFLASGEAAPDELAPHAILNEPALVRCLVPDGDGPLLPPMAGLKDAPGEDSAAALTEPVPATRPDLPRRGRRPAARDSQERGSRPSPSGVPAPDSAAPASSVGPTLERPAGAIPVLPLREALTIVPLFRRLSPDLLVTMADAMTERRYPHGADIVRQGDDGNTLFVMLSGQARVHRAGAAGEDVELALLGPGGFFGEMSLLDGQPRSATVRAVTDVRCALLPRWALESLIRANPLMAMQMMAVLSMRLRAVERLLTV